MTVLICLSLCIKIAPMVFNLDVVVVMAMVRIVSSHGMVETLAVYSRRCYFAFYSAKLKRYRV